MIFILIFFDFFSYDYRTQQNLWFTFWISKQRLNFELYLSTLSQVKDSVSLKFWSIFCRRIHIICAKGKKSTTEIKSVQEEPWRWQGAGGWLDFPRMREMWEVGAGRLGQMQRVFMSRTYEESYYRLSQLNTRPSPSSRFLLVWRREGWGKPRNYGGIAYVRCVPNVVLYKPCASIVGPTLQVYIIGRCERAGRWCAKRGRMDASAREQTHVRAPIAECSKESLCILGTQFRDAIRGKEGEINTCYPVAEVFPSGWSKNVSLYAKRNLPEARRFASDFNREPIYRSDGFLFPLNFS